jgi:hypothetical protein
MDGEAREGIEGGQCGSFCRNFKQEFVRELACCDREQCAYSIG